jgi:hypothetical protein
MEEKFFAIKKRGVPRLGNLYITRYELYYSEEYFKKEWAEWKLCPFEKVFLGSHALR